MIHLIDKAVSIIDGPACMSSFTRANFTDVLITPEAAQYWLKEKNNRNRKLKTRQIIKYAKAMEQGRWTKGSRIIFYEDGTVCDGQNRLSAVVLSGIPCHFDIAVGASTEEGANIDTGAKRSVTDALKISRFGGDSDWYANKDAVAMLNWFFRVTPGDRQHMTHHHVIEHAEKNEEWLRPAVDMSRSSTSVRGLTTAGFFCQVALATRAGVSLEVLSDFHSRYISGENYDRDKNAVIKLREYCLQRPGAWTQSIEESVRTARKAQRAIQAFVSGQPISKLYEPSEWIYEVPNLRA